MLVIVVIVVLCFLFLVIFDLILCCYVSFVVVLMEVCVDFSVVLWMVGFEGFVRVFEVDVIFYWLIVLDLC